MKLIEIIPHLVDLESISKFLSGIGLTSNPEELIIYMKDDLKLDSDIVIFDENETEDDIIYNKDGIKYIQFFNIPHVLDLIEFDLGLKHSNFSNSEIAERLLEYRRNDA